MNPPAVFLDLETRSRCNIKRAGGHVYVRHDSTELLCGVAMVVRGDQATMILWGTLPSLASVKAKTWIATDKVVRGLGFDPADLSWVVNAGVAEVPEWLLDLHHEGALFVAHNGEGFDRPYLERHGLPVDARWMDTAHRARQSGLPSGLDTIGAALFGIGKDERGAKLLKRLYKPMEKGPAKGEFLPVNGGNLGLVARYCAQDVLLMAAAWYDEDWAAPHIDDPVRELHCIMDRRGVPSDLVLAARLHAECEVSKDAWLKKAAGYGLTETQIRSHEQFPAWLKEQGWVVENAKKDTMQRVLAEIKPDHENYDAITTAVEARLAFNRVTAGKAVAALEKTCPDGRMRGTLVYHGAHTGRWAGRGIQPQNLPAPVKDFTANVYDMDVPKAAKILKVKAEEVLASMLRGILVAMDGFVLLMIDYSQIEARVLKWLAGDSEGLEVFRQGRDVYAATAAPMFNLPEGSCGKGTIARKVGKIATLACGYQGGPMALQAFAGTDFSLEENDMDPVDVVNRWRDANPLIAGVRKGIWRTPEGNLVVTRKGGLWKDLQYAVVDVLKGGGERTAGRCVISMRGKHLVITLPSGRPLVYRNAAYEMWENNYGGVSRSIVFDSVRFGKVKRDASYGGKMAENLCQAVARDVMASAMLDLEAAGFENLFTIHDEIVVQVPEGRAEELMALANEIMTRPVAWAPELPLAVEGEIGKRYRK